MSDKQHEAIAELIPAYALGALDPDEAEAVALHLAACDACQQELAAFTAIVDALPLATPQVTPPAHLRQRLLTQVRPGASVAPPVAPTRPNFAARLRAFLRAPQFRPALATLTLFLLLIALFVLVPTSPPPERVTLTPTDAAPGAVGRIEFSSEDTATLIVVGLPDLPAEEQYQLWLIDGEQRLSGAVFSVDADGSASVPVAADRLIDEYNAIGITIEPAGGSPGPTGTRVLGYKL